MNRVRMCILRKMWDDKKSSMISQLHKQILKNKKGNAQRKKRVGLLMSIDDELRDESLNAYYLLCKEKGAHSFMHWRIEQQKLQKRFPFLKKALRLRRLIAFDKFNKEEHIFKLYTDNADNFDAVKEELMRLELEI